MFALYALMKKFFFYILSILFILKIQVLSVGCANMMPPQGGFRDSIPPIMLKASPPDSSKNFKETRITLTFDEFVDVQNVHENLIVSPVPKIEPNVEARLRTVVIRLKDTLQPNTTYTLNFGNAIKDINEGNIRKNFSYIFSTGPFFDSLTLSGKVLVAESGKVDTTLVVMLHQHGEDSAVVNEKPRYITRLDSLGNFRFRNLPSGTFYIYALQDEGGGHRYLSEKQLFGFADSAVVLSADNKPVVLYAFSGKTQTPATVPQLGIKQKGGGNNNNAEKRLRLQSNIASGQLDLLSNLTISTEQPFKDLDTSIIHFSTDSSFVPVTGYKIGPDTSKKKLILQYNWKENTVYHLILEKNFAVDTSGKALLKSDTLTFRTKKLSDYGSLAIRFKNYDPSVNPVLLFIQNGSVIKSIPLTSAKVTDPIFIPGDYELRILQDRNKNGTWDTGDFFDHHLQPEIVKPVSRKITVKPNWENEFDIEL